MWRCGKRRTTNPALTVAAAQLRPSVQLAPARLLADDQGRLHARPEGQPRDVTAAVRMDAFLAWLDRQLS